MLLLTREDEKFVEGREKEKKRVAVHMLKDGEDQIIIWLRRHFRVSN